MIAALCYIFGAVFAGFTLYFAVHGNIAYARVAVILMIISAVHALAAERRGL